jgi:hypothetical protein
MPKPINDDSVIHESNGVRCPYCHQQLAKKKIQTMKDLNEGKEPYWKWMHMRAFGNTTDYTDKCPGEEGSISSGYTYGMQPHEFAEYTSISKQSKN